jgi:uncharacterized protein
VTRGTLRHARAALPVFLALLLGGCFLRKPVTDIIGFRPKPMRNGRASPAEWNWDNARLDTISRTDSAGGVLAWWGAARTAPCAGVLLLHGKGRNRSEFLPLGRALQTAGFSVLLVDYRGYGDTPGAPSTAGLYADAELAYQSLRSRLVDSLTPIVIVGHSMGTALAARLAREHAPIATVYMSPYTRISALVRSRAGALGPRLFDTTAFAFNPIDDAPFVHAQTLVVVAGRDLLINRSVSDAFVAALTPAPSVIRDSSASHNGVLASAKTVSAVTDTLRAWVPCSGRRDAGGI